MEMRCPGEKQGGGSRRRDNYSGSARLAKASALPRSRVAELGWATAVHLLAQWQLLTATYL